MKFKEKDLHLLIDGMGIVFYSPETNKSISEGCNFFEVEYSKPEDVAKHIKKGDIVGFVREVVVNSYSSLERATQMKTY